MPKINLGFQSFFYYQPNSIHENTGCTCYNFNQVSRNFDLIIDSVNLSVLKAKSITKASLETNQMFKIQLLDQRY